MGTAVTILAVCDAISSTISGRIAGIVGIQSMDDLTEDYPAGDLPLSQTYWENDFTDPTAISSDRATFRKGVFVTERTIHYDLVVRQRSQINEDFAKVAEFAEKLVQALDTERTKPLFGLSGIQAMTYRVERVTFQRGGTLDAPANIFVGARAIITVRIF